MSDRGPLIGRRRSLAGAGAAILAAARATFALATAPASGAIGHRAAAARDRDCTTAQLDVTFVDKPDGAADATYYPIQSSSVILKRTFATCSGTSVTVMTVLPVNRLPGL